MNYGDILTVQRFSIFGNVRNSSLTSQHGGLKKYHQAGSNWRGNLLYFMRFSSSLCLPFCNTTTNRRRNGRRLVHKVMNNGFEMSEKARFIFLCKGQFSGNFACYYHLHFGISLVKNFIRS